MPRQEHVGGRSLMRLIEVAPLILLLAMVNALSFMDRMAVGALGLSIRADLALGGAQFGLVTGAAFAVVYALAALPVARTADRYGPQLILPCCVAFWSLAMVATSYATSFEALAASRFLMALGEAGAASIAYALVSASVEPARRASAIAVVATGAPLGSFAGAEVFPAIASVHGWRDALLFIGMAGLLFALLLWPALRMIVAARPAARTTRLALRDALTGVLRHGDQRALAIGYGAISLTMTAVVAWMPQLLQLWHGQSLRVAGNIFGMAILTGGLGGTLLAPMLMSRLFGPDRLSILRRAMFLAPCGAALLALSLWTSGGLLVATLAGGIACLSGLLPLIFARVPDVAHELGAAEANVGIFLPGNLVGASLGPLVVGLFDDALAPAYGAWGMATGMLAVLTVAPIGALILANDLRVRAVSRLPDGCAA